MSYYRRRLPHQHPDGIALFVTWHLHGSLPYGRYPPPHKMNSGQAFVWMDRFLDTSTSGPQYLRQPVIAQMVVDAIRRGVTLGHYRLDAYVVMANHVHLLIVPGIPVSRLLKSLKGYTAREANRCLGRTGEAFWQAESYDHWARDEREWARIKAYIEDNPVKAGLVKSAAGYQWSSATAGVETSLDAADTSVCATYGPPSLNGI